MTHPHRWWSLMCIQPMRSPTSQINSHHSSLAAPAMQNHSIENSLAFSNVVRFSPGVSIHAVANMTKTGVMNTKHVMVPVNGTMGIQPNPTPRMTEMAAVAVIAAHHL